MIAALPVTTIAQACGGQLIGHPLAPTTAITGLAIDSRRIKSGDLFAALPGARADGHDFASVAMDQGAAALLVQRQVEIDCPQIVVDDCQRALADVARLARQPYGGVMLGVTGSAGKTTTKNLLHAVLSKAGRTLATEGNLNNELGVPLTLSRLDLATEFAVIEMGAGKPGDIAVLQQMVKPDISVLLTVVPAHIEHYGHLDAIADTKAAILDGLSTEGLAVVNGDLPWADQWRQRAAPAQVITFGFSKGVDYRAKHIQLNGFAGSECQIKTPQGDVVITLALPGRQGIANALATVAVAQSLGISNKAICEGLQSVLPAKGRGQLYIVNDEVQVIDDSYNANPSAVSAAIEVLATCSGRRRLVLGSMLELGQDSDLQHRAIGVAAREAGIDDLWVVGELALPAAAGFGPGACVFDSVDTLCEREPQCEGADVVLVKASRGAALDRLVTTWVGKQESRAC